MKNCIKKIRELKGWSQEQLAESVGVSQPTITRIERGGAIKDGMEKRFAKALECSLEELFGFSEYQPVAVKKTPVLGVVEAGIWTESQDFSEIETIDFPPPSGYPPESVFALKVKGNSMNKVFLNGDYIVCVHCDACPNIEYGKFVVAQRTRASLYETTVKRLTIKDDGTQWLCPESTDDKYQPIKIDGKEGEEIRIIAVVIAAYKKV